VGNWHTVFNGVDLAKYVFVDRVPDDAPLVFLGRVERMKGAHNAIAIARRSGRRLVIAGNIVTSGPHADYFNLEIRPYLDEQRVSYIGPVDDAQKNALLGSAAALLMPIEWDEPFGIVMAEALACGTPVIGFARGSVPEVVREGVNGFTSHDVDGAVAALSRLRDIDRHAARLDCEARFSDRAIVDQYEHLYYDLLAAVRAPAR
jgi:glycosyltransferase involved in cell wall biosynthesis